MIKKAAPLWIALAGCLWGAMGIFVRQFNSYGITSMNIVFVRSLFTAAVVFLFAAICKPSLLKVRFRDLWIFAGCGLFSIVFFNFCYFSAIEVMSLSVAAILLYTAPIFVMLMSALFFREKITLRKVAAIALSIVGLALVTGIFDSSVVLSPTGILFGIGSAVGYALYSIFSRLALNRGYTPLTITGWSFAFAALFSAFFCDFRLFFELYTEKPSMILFSIFFALVVSVFPYLLYSYGLTGVENSTASVIASVEPVAATVFGALLFNEYPSVASAIGIILVLGALLLCIERTKKKKDG